MPLRRTPWANTLRATGLIFVYERSESKLSQVAGYAIGVAARRWPAGRLVFEDRKFLRCAAGKHVLRPVPMSGEVP
jgi:hypothetical protein